MRILHVSHNGLPDPRVEKAALTMRKRGERVSFLGGEPIRSQNLDAFEAAACLPAPRPFSMILNPRLRWRWLRAIERARPDVIHAHNIFAAVVAGASGLPLVYDDHELWSKCGNLSGSQNWLRRTARAQLERLVPWWEARLARQHPCLATNENAAQVLGRHGGWVGVVRNAPLLAMVDGLELDGARRGAVYVGADFERPRFAPHRDMTGLREVLAFDVLFGMPHRQLMETLTRYRVGLTPWRHHPVLRFKDQNRNYEYLHAGLQVVANRQIETSFADDPFVHGFDSYADIAAVVDRVPAVDPCAVARHARDLYTWERQEPVIVEAYERALG